MKKLVIRQSSSKISHFPSESYVDRFLSKHCEIPYKMKQMGKDTLSITFDEHIDSNFCNLIAKKLSLDISSISDSRCILVFPY